MAQDRRFTVATAFAAAADDELAHWVGDFLASRGSGNATLAAALAQREHRWLGPWVLLWFYDPADHREFRDRVRAFVT